MGDGTVLRSTVYRPADDTESFPALLTRTPYGRDLAVNSAYFNPTTVAAAGYVVIMQDCRGRFGSDGEFNPSVNEASDGAETVEWAARLPYSNGKVGMWGRSYFAETQWRAAQEAPAPLRALGARCLGRRQRQQRRPVPRRCPRVRKPPELGHASASLNQLFREFADDPERKGKELQAWLELDESFADSTIFGTLPLRQLEPRLGTFMNSQVLPSAGEGPGSPFTPALGCRIRATGAAAHAPHRRLVRYLCTQQSGPVPAAAGP
jgi:putative CocE/NonD family hydrolase